MMLKTNSGKSIKGIQRSNTLPKKMMKKKSSSPKQKYKKTLTVEVHGVSRDSIDASGNPAYVQNTALQTDGSGIDTGRDML